MNERLERFCRNVVAGMTLKSAYRDAGYSDKFTGGPHKLSQRAEVKQRIETLREIQRIRLNVTMNSLVLDLRRGQDLAIAEGNPTAFVAATMGLAKLLGFLKEEREHDIAIYLNRPLREPTRELELTPDQWIERWAPKPLTDGTGNGKTNGHGSNGHSDT